MRAPILIFGLTLLVYASALATAGDVSTAETQGELGVGSGEAEDTEGRHVGDVKSETSSADPFPLELLFAPLEAACAFVLLYAGRR